MLSIFEIKDYVDEFLKSNDININTIINYNFNDSKALFKYDREQKIIKINNDRKMLYNDAKHTNAKIKDILIILTCHEVGHSLDNIGITRVDREINAYNLGLQYVPKRLIDKYNQVNEENINRHKRKDECYGE